MEDGHPARSFERSSNHVGAVRIVEVMIRVGARAGDHEGHIAPERQAHGERPRAVGVERVNQRRSIGRDVCLDRGLLARGEVPHGELDPAPPERLSDARDRHSVAAQGWRAERGENRHAGRHRPEHTGADAARKARGAVATLNLSHALERPHIMYADV